MELMVVGLVHLFFLASLSCLFDYAAVILNRRLSILISF